MVDESGLNTDPKKVWAIRDWHEPRCLEDVHSFLCLVGYYRSHISQYVDLTAPLHNLTLKGHE